MSAVETLLAEVLSAHYKGSGWAPRRHGVTPHKGRWSCGCGERGLVEFGRKTTDIHRAHVAAEQAKALREAGLLGGIVHTSQSMLRQITEGRMKS